MKTMAKNKGQGEFSFKATSVSYEDGAGGAVVRLHLEGKAAGFGTVLGTMSLFGDAAGAQSGRTTWVGEAYRDNGDVVQGTGAGYFAKRGKHKWRIRSVVRTSTGDLFTSDGLLALDGRSYTGRLAAWK
jgi:hypothetical protein